MIKIVKRVKFKTTSIVSVFLMIITIMLVLYGGYVCIDYMKSKANRESVDDNAIYMVFANKEYAIDQEYIYEEYITDIQNDAIDNILEMTEHTKSSISIMVTILGILMTAVTLLSSVISIVASVKTGQTEKLLEELNDAKKDIRNLKYNLKLTVARKYRQENRYDYAKDELTQLEKSIGKDDFELRGAILDEKSQISLEQYNKEPNSNNAPKYIEDAIISCNKSLEEYKKLSEADNHYILDSYLMLGCLYGVKAKLYKRLKRFAEQANLFFEQSIENFKQILSASNVKDGQKTLTLKNLAITYFLKGDETQGFQTIQQCINISIDDIDKEKFAKDLFEKDEIALLETNTVEEIQKRIENYINQISKDL